MLCQRPNCVSAPVWFRATAIALYILAPQWSIVSVDHTLGFESASKSAISFSKSQAVSKKTASPCAIWNCTGLSVEMLAGNIVREDSF